MKKFLLSLLCMAAMLPAMADDPVVINADNISTLKDNSIVAFMYGQIGFGGKAWLNDDQTPIVTEEEAVVPTVGAAGTYVMEAASEGYFYLRSMASNKYISRSAGKSAAGDQCDIVMVESKEDACEFQIEPTTASNANVYKNETTNTVQLLAKVKDSWTAATNYTAIKLGGNTGVPANWGLGGNGPWKLWRCYYLGQYIPTGIESAAAVNDAAIFNLNGQKVNKAQKGLYIINGKKAVVK